MTVPRVRLLLNENLPGTVIRLLRERGHDVISVKESLRGERDEVILARGQADQRVMVTQDKDFAELAFARGLPAACGVILFRLSSADPDAENRRILDVLDADLNWAGHFAVVTHDRIRMRLLPPAEGGMPS